MIIKSLSRKSNTGQLVKYIFRYVFNDSKTYKSNPDEKFIIRHNIRSRSVKGFINEFNENEKYRLVHRKDSVKLFHTVISFSNKDREKINDKALKQIAKKFIEERGLNNIYTGTKHEDKEHVHLHLIISGTQLNGRSSRISKQRFHSIKLALDRFQREKYPELENSLPEHGKSKRLAKEAVIEKIQNDRQTNKQDLVNAIEGALANSKTSKQFIAGLKKSGHEPYYRNGKLQGIKYKSKTKFRFSRLGFSKERLTELDSIKTTQTQTLDELSNLRSSRNKLQTRAILEPQADSINKGNADKDATEMEAINSIRSSHSNQEIEDREYDQGETAKDNGEENNDESDEE